jgi:hypothetical protein
MPGWFGIVSTALQRTADGSSRVGVVGYDKVLDPEQLADIWWPATFGIRFDAVLALGPRRRQDRLDRRVGIGEQHPVELGINKPRLTSNPRVL